VNAVDPTLLQLLVLLVSGATAFVVGLVFKRLGEIATDVKEIRADLGEHTADLAKHEEQIAQLRREVDRMTGRAA
jgi:F0F1-type ATP synthase membrane subunit b/b'